MPETVSGIAPAASATGAARAPRGVPDFSVVIPVFNEAGNVAPLVAEIHGALRNRPDWEIVIVDDASTDGTGRELAGLLPATPRLRVLAHRRRSGQSAALVTGVRAARGRWIVTLDGDGQNDPADIPVLIDRRAPAGAAGPALIAGVRRRRRDTWGRRAASRIANRVRQWLLGDGFPDTGCGLKVFERAAFLELPCFSHMHRYLPALFLRDGAGVVAVPVNHRPRRAGRSKYGIHDRLWVGITDLLGVMWLLRRPVRTDADEVVSQ